ncbi:SycD/LcrH family type III secretion system chaperone [Pseudomonas entomophila]|uniref:SycD/LcrH family type III secretion system chaperone n=1 Tax=Pseudomonas entomophila TaxID=312306 RepID=UPI001F003725|nr:SycD/LcrH family type III secretion system chaperone [Pseudomonas entomophila]MCG8291449.1 SycD/LcrH family type III secretion system chaperone [Pseudomonas entomophila]
MTQVNDSHEQDLELALEAFMNHGGTLAMLKDISQDQLEELYAMAHSHYQAGKLKEAETLFKGLTVLNHYDARFLLGLGACRQGLKQYELAIQAYAYGAMMAVDDPRFPFHAAECQVELADWVAAESGFYSAHALAETRPEQAQLGARAGLMLEHIASHKRNKQ